jgi:hypothetical protein
MKVYIIGHGDLLVAQRAAMLYSGVSKTLSQCDGRLSSLALQVSMSRRDWPAGLHSRRFRLSNSVNATIRAQWDRFDQLEMSGQIARIGALAKEALGIVDDRLVAGRAKDQIRAAIELAVIELAGS